MLTHLAEAAPQSQRILMSADHLADGGRATSSTRTGHDIGDPSPGPNVHGTIEPDLEAESS